MDWVFLYALDALPSNERPIAEACISACAECRNELEKLRPIVASFVSWPTDLLRPSPSLWNRLAHRIAEDTGSEMVVTDLPRQTNTQAWQEAAPGISYKLISKDTERSRVSMLVRLAPGTHYPPHRHADLEELHLLYGELMVNDKKLYPGDYLKALPQTVDHQVWSETGCTCLLMTSTNDLLV